MGTVSVTHTFKYDTTAPLEATYVFPIDDTSSAVTGFEMSINGDLTVIAKITEKDSAFDKYSDAIASGRSSGLLEQGVTRDLFKISLGNIPAGNSNFQRNF
jgi:hypothetical protein